MTASFRSPRASFVSFVDEGRNEALGQRPCFRALSGGGGAACGSQDGRLSPGRLERAPDHCERRLLVLSGEDRTHGAHRHAGLSIPRQSLIQ